MKQIMKANGLDILIKIKLTIVALFVVLPSLATAQVSASESQPTKAVRLLSMAEAGCGMWGVPWHGQAWPRHGQAGILGPPG